VGLADVVAQVSKSCRLVIARPGALDSGKPTHICEVRPPDIETLRRQILIRPSENQGLLITQLQRS